MERIAFIAGEHFIAWSSVILTLAACGAICIFLSMYLAKGGSAAAALFVLPLTGLLGIYASRIVHWYCRMESYGSFAAAMTNLSSGGYALLGMFAGAFAAAVIARAFGIHRDLPGMLDAMSLAGSAGIAVGRLSMLFNSADRGQIVDSVRSLPWVYPVTNAVSGATEYRLATFLLQAMAAGVIFLALSAHYLLGRKRRRGDTVLLFLLCYCASQVVLDSTRYDSIYFHSNGFVSIVQVFSAVALVASVVVFSVRMVRNRGFGAAAPALWAAIAALVGVAGYMEYHVQRHGDQALFAYGIMSACLTAVVVLGVVIYNLGLGTVHQKARRGGKFLRQ